MKTLTKLFILLCFLNFAITVSAQKVYINKGKSDYHLLTCKYLDPAHDSLDITSAVKKGLGACTVCNPNVPGASSSGSMGADKSMEATKSVEKSDMMQKNPQSSKVTTSLCTVINSDGKRCPGNAEEGSKYCLEHRNYKK